MAVAATAATLRLQMAHGIRTSPSAGTSLYCECRIALKIVRYWQVSTVPQARVQLVMPEVVAAAQPVNQAIRCNPEGANVLEGVNVLRMQKQVKSTRIISVELPWRRLKQAGARARSGGFG